MIEEAQEVSQAKDPDEMRDELADVLELVRALAKYYDLDPKELEKHRQQKAKERGGFSKRLFLEEVKQ